MKIATTSICKNEMKYVEKWYDNLKDEVDYITVLDTGSTDGTYEWLIDKSKEDSKLIVSQKIITPWRFDAARNEALLLIPNDVDVFTSIDLDEIYDKGFGNIIREEWPKDNYFQASFTYYRTPNGEHQFTYHKIYSNHIKWCWKYPVHELLERDENEPITEGLLLDLTGKIILRHYQDHSINRSPMYLKLLELRKKENPLDGDTNVYLVREYFLNEWWGKVIQAVDNMEKKKIASAPYKLSFCAMLRALAYGNIGKDKQLMDGMEYAIQICPEYRDPYVKLAKFLLSHNYSPKAAKMIMEKCEKNSKRLNTFTEIDVDSFGPGYEFLKRDCGMSSKSF